MKCKYCEIKINDGDSCDNCWEVANRLDDFVSTEKGRQYVEFVLNNKKKWLEKNGKKKT